MSKTDADPDGIATSPGDDFIVDKATVAHYCNRKVFAKTLSDDKDSLAAKEIEAMALELRDRRNNDLSEEEVQALRFFFGPVLRDPTFSSVDLSEMWHDVRRRAQDVLRAVIDDAKRKFNNK